MFYNKDQQFNYRLPFIWKLNSIRASLGLSTSVTKQTRLNCHGTAGKYSIEYPTSSFWPTFIVCSQNSNVTVRNAIGYFNWGFCTNGAGYDGNHSSCLHCCNTCPGRIQSKLNITAFSDVSPLVRYEMKDSHHTSDWLASSFIKSSWLHCMASK